MARPDTAGSFFSGYDQGILQKSSFPFSGAPDFLPTTEGSLC
jgi:hypothetical protein